MSFRSRVLNLVEVILRVPPLFVIDEILKIGIGLEDLTQHDLTNIQDNYDNIGENHLNLTTTTIVSYDSIFYRYLLISFARLLLSGLGCVIALCLFILNTKHLMVVYMYLISVGVVFVSYWTNVNTIKLFMMNSIDPSITTTTTINDNLTTTTTFETTTLTNLYEIIFNLNLNNLIEKFSNVGNNDNNKIYELIQNYVLQSFLSYIFINIHLGPRYNMIQKLLPITFLLPTLLMLLPISKTIINNLPIFSILLPLALIKFILWSSLMSSLNTLYNGYLHTKNFISNFGMSALVESEWNRLNIPEVLRTFWLLRVIENASIFFISGYWYLNNNDIDNDNLIMSPYYRLIKYLLITGCDTLTAVLGITSIVSYICYYIGKLFQWILLTDDENDKNFGTISAIVFYILALQTGLTGLEPEIRFIRLCRNFCLLFTAILHFTHNVLNPLLMSLSASHNPSIRRHLHALFVCLILVILPIIFMYYLWSREEPSTWLFAVTAFSIEVIVKVFVSLSIYSLFLLDAKRETFWEKLDDYIYYIRAFGNTIEFCFGIFLFFNGAWILLFESGSAIRAVMMCIHAYFNIWCDARAGWSVFIKRRTAVNKIESLPEANDEQLRQLDDVCAICYQEMRSAKITKCKHFFHGVCLRKWLYVQDRCPLCHEILHSIDYDGKNSSELNIRQQEEQQQQHLINEFNNR